MVLLVPEILKYKSSHYKSMGNFPDAKEHVKVQGMQRPGTEAKSGPKSSPQNENGKYPKIQRFKFLLTSELV